MNRSGKTGVTICDDIFDFSLWTQSYIINFTGLSGLCKWSKVTVELDKDLYFNISLNLYKPITWPN